MRPDGDAGGQRAAPAAPANPESSAAAEDVALRILTAAAQSAAALQRRLLRRGFTPEAAAAAVAAMRKRGYVDDAALAGSIAARRQRSGHGRLHVAAELRVRGLDDESIAGTLRDVDTDDERAAALALGRRLAVRPANDLADPRGRQRLGGALQRRGFDTETVTWVLRALASEAPPG